MEIAILGSWIAWSFTNAAIASRRGNNPATFLIVSLLCSPLLAYLYLLATPAPVEEARTQAIVRALVERQ